MRLRNSGALCALFLVVMAGWPLASSAQATYVYSVEAVPPPSGAAVAVVLSARRGVAAVTATVLAFNAAGIVGDDPREVTIPGNGFVRLDNAALALGHDTGPRRIKIRADGELDVSAMRVMWGDHAVALPVHERVIVPETYGTIQHAFTRDRGELGFYWGVALNQPSRALATQRAAGACPESTGGGSGCPGNDFLTVSGSECVVVAIAKDGGGSFRTSRHLLTSTIGASYGLAKIEAESSCLVQAGILGYRNTPGTVDRGCDVPSELIFCNEPGGTPFTTGGYYSVDSHFAAGAASLSAQKAPTETQGEE